MMILIMRISVGYGESIVAHTNRNNVGVVSNKFV